MRTATTKAALAAWLRELSVAMDTIIEDGPFFSFAKVPADLHATTDDLYRRLSDAQEAIDEAVTELEEDA